MRNYLRSMLLAPFAVAGAFLFILSVFFNPLPALALGAGCWLLMR